MKCLIVIACAASLMGCDRDQISSAPDVKIDANPFFSVSESDREQFAVDESVGRIDMRFDAAVIFPALKRNPKLNGSDLPRAATIYVGIPTLTGRYVLMDGEKCDGALHSTTLMPENKSTDEVQMAFDGIAQRPRDKSVVAKFANEKGTWFVECLKGMTCRNLFSNKTWSAEFIVDETDLCASPEMNAKLATIVNRWTK